MVDAVGMASSGATGTITQRGRETERRAGIHSEDRVM
jgi:hypothetical protein